MASKIEKLLRVMADLQKFNDSAPADDAAHDTELTEDDLDLVAAAAWQPAFDDFTDPADKT